MAVGLVFLDNIFGIPSDLSNSFCVWFWSTIYSDPSQGDRQNQTETDKHAESKKRKTIFLHFLQKIQKALPHHQTDELVVSFNK